VKTFIIKMPPIRTSIAGKFAHLSSRKREVLKPYEEPTVRHENGKKPVPFKDEFMSIDEFCDNTIKREESDEERQDGQFRSEDKDYPKPNVDLLASLLTLGRMIRDQKKLIQQEASLRALRTTNNTVTISAVMTDPIISATFSSNTQSKNINALEMDVEPGKMEVSASPTTQEDIVENNSSSSSEIDSSVSSSLSSDRIESSSSSSNGRSSSKRRVIPDEVKDVDYWERRKRNNLAARKSREDRRKKEINVLKTAKELEDENSYLTSLLNRLTSRNEELESKLQGIRFNDGQSSNSLTSSDN